MRSPWVWYLLGLIHAGIIGGFIVMMNAAFLASDREAINHVCGAWGEENTREEVAIDSKWRNQITDRDRQEIVEAARKVRLRSQGVVQTLLRSERGSHRASGGSVQVTPLVVVWGAAQGALPDVVRTEGVEVVPGQGLRAWLRQQHGEPVDKDAAHDLIRRLEGYRDHVAAASKGVTP